MWFTVEDEKWNGSERRLRDRRMNAFMRRGLAVWIVVFTVAVGYALKHDAKSQHEIKVLVRESNQRVDELKKSKAQVTALQRTNCGLVKFILTARRARWESYKKTHDVTDLQATKGYEALAHPFLENDSAATGDCQISKSLLTPDRPLNGSVG